MGEIRPEMFLIISAVVVIVTIGVTYTFAYSRIHIPERQEGITVTVLSCDTNTLKILSRGEHNKRAVMNLYNHRGEYLFDVTIPEMTEEQITTIRFPETIPPGDYFLFNEGPSLSFKCN